MSLQRHAGAWLGLALMLAVPAAHAAHHHRVRVTYTPAHKSHARTAQQDATLDAVLRTPGIRSSSALVIDQMDGSAVYRKNTANVVPIASITKLMTAMVVLDANLPLDENMTVDEADVDLLKHTTSRLTVGTTLTRAEFLNLALMSSENRAAAALGRNYPGGTAAFVTRMNRKAAELGMLNTHFVDPTGLDSSNVSTAEDLVRMVQAACQYDVIREFTTASNRTVQLASGRLAQFNNTNRLVRVRSDGWEIGLSKTGYISEAGRCLVMQANIAARPMVIVLLDSNGKNTRIADANRIKRWLESQLVRRKSGLS